jgi:hypothetical protein
VQKNQQQGAAGVAETLDCTLLHACGKVWSPTASTSSWQQSGLVWMATANTAYMPEE